MVCKQTLTDLLKNENQQPLPQQNGDNGHAPNLLEAFLLLSERATRKERYVFFEQQGVRHTHHTLKIHTPQLGLTQNRPKWKMFMHNHIEQNKLGVEIKTTRWLDIEEQIQNALLLLWKKHIRNTQGEIDILHHIARHNHQALCKIVITHQSHMTGHQQAHWKKQWKTLFPTS